MRKLIIMGAGGRDFHNFNVAFRNDRETEVVAFTAAQIPGIDDRVYPPALAGTRYPNGIPVRPDPSSARSFASTVSTRSSSRTRTCRMRR